MYSKSMRRILSLVIAFAVIALSPAYSAETGTPDPTPTPKIGCGVPPCSFYVGQNFSFGGFDDESFSSIPNIGQFCQPASKESFASCRIVGKNAIPTNNLNKVILKNGWVSVIYAQKWDLSRVPVDIFPPEFPGMKITLVGANAEFGPYPVPNFTFSSDRKTVYIKAHRIARPSPSDNGIDLQIKAPMVGSISVKGYLEIAENSYSETATDIGNILVISKYDQFDVPIDKKTKFPDGTKTIKRYSYCTKGKAVKKVLQKNLKSFDCPTGFKLKS
jgi:hypothetical protein